MSPLALWNRTLGDPLRGVEAASLAHRQSEAGKRADWKTVTVLLTVAVCLTLQNYTAHPTKVADAAGFVARQFGDESSAADARQQLGDWGGDQRATLAWWAACSVLTYALLPALAVKFVLRERLRDYGFKVRGLRAGWPVYALCFAVMVPVVALASGVARFQDAYPFYRVSSRDQLDGDFLTWELLYASQFVALEFFFRGFLVHGTKHRFGVYSAFAMMLPYCMIHMGKPPLECAASIVAGIALGLVSLATRSIWSGAALHISVAWGMDFATLARRGLVG